MVQRRHIATTVILLVYSVNAVTPTDECLQPNRGHLWRGGPAGHDEEEGLIFNHFGSEQTELLSDFLIVDTSGGSDSGGDSGGDSGISKRSSGKGKSKGKGKGNGNGNTGGDNNNKNDNNGKAKGRNQGLPAPPPGADLGQYCSKQTLTIDKSVDTSAGSINSPRDGRGYYPTKIKCKWRIVAPSGTVIQVQFGRIDIENSADCMEDALEIYDGSDHKAELKGRYCGTGVPKSFCSSGRYLSLEFSTDKKKKSRTGFTINYSIHSYCPDDLVEETCSSDVVELDSREGIILSPGYPHDSYPNNANCRWLITAGPDYIISLVMNDFNLEDSTNCMRDSVRVYDGPDQRSDLLGTFCGKRVVPELVSTSNKLFVHFVSDSSKKKSGFRAEYAWKTEEGPSGRAFESFCGQPEIFQFQGRIIGGTEVSPPHSFPWLVQMQIETSGQFVHWCGAVLVGPQWVLTATHCTYYRNTRGYPVDLKDSSNLNRIRFVTGEHNLLSKDGRETVHYVTMAIPYPGHDNATYLNDLTLFKITPNAPLRPEVRPICLPTRRLSNEVNMIVAGWGNTLPPGVAGAMESASAVLNHVRLPLLRTDVCNEPDYYDGRVQHGMICAGYTEGQKDACQGDSGGPLFARDNIAERYYLYGLVSWGMGCAQPKKPGVYTDIFYYAEWIRQQMTNN